MMFNEISFIQLKHNFVWNLEKTTNMKDIKIGNLIFTKKSILILAFCLFLNGINIGVMLAMKSNNFFLLNYILFFLPYILFYKSIKNNVIEIK